MSGTPFAWAPNPARTILLWDYATSPPSGRLAAAASLRWADKPAAATLDCTLDASALLANDSDTLAATVLTTGCSLVAQLIAGGMLTVWLGGGTGGIDATIDMTMTTALGRRAHRIARILVV